MAWNPFAQNTSSTTPVAQAAPNPTPGNVPPVVNSKQSNPQDINMSDPSNPTSGQNLGQANTLPQTTNPNSQVDPNSPNAPQSPLDLFEPLWQNRPTEGAEAPDFSLGVTPQDMQKVLPQLNFSQNIPQDLMAKFREGDANAILDVFNHMSKEAYSTSLQHSLALTNSNLEARGTALPDLVNNQVHQSLTTNAVSQSSIPNANHPSVKRELNRIAGQFRSANPGATPQEIVAASEKYFTELMLATAQQPEQPNNQNGRIANTDDWESWLD